VQKTELQKRPAYLLESVDNALRLLQLLRDEGRLQIKDAAAELGIAPSTAHRLLAMLVYRGFASRDEHRAYLPGPGMGNGPANASWARQLRDIAAPHLELLCDRLDETVNLMIRAGTRVRFLLSIEAHNVLRVSDRQGTVLPARHASGGKALLAELDEPALRRLYQSPGSELAGDQLDEPTFATLLEELVRVRRTGYALNVEQTEAGIAAIGMVVVARRPEAMAAFSVATPRSRFRSLLEGQTVELMRAVRQELEHDLSAAGLA
jgi:IclR family transcriptional regulator, acetate operon repressor